VGAGTGGADVDAGAPDAPTGSGGAAPDAAIDAPDASIAADAGPDLVDAGPEAPVGPCGIPEFEPNDTSQTATPYTLGTAVVGCLGTTTDDDFYQLTAPAGDPSGGYFLAAVTNAAGLAATAVVSSSDNVPVLTYNQISVGRSIYFYWATSPGQTYYVHIADYPVAGTLDKSTYTLKIDYTKVDDPSEPNDTRDTPRPITLGTPITAYYFAGYKMGTLSSADYYDYYSIKTDTTGPATVTVQNVANEVSLSAAIYKPGNVFVTSASSPNYGADFTLPVTLQAGTTYNIQISAVAGGAAATGTSQSIPDQFTRPYHLTVTQP
jgi:hypothetical protein